METSNETLIRKEEALSPQEKRKLIRQLILLWLIAIGMAVGVTYFFFFFRVDVNSEMNIPLTIFSVFFFGILAFIVYSHTRNAFATTKTVFSGVVLEKKTMASAAKNTSLQERFSVNLSGKWFGVEFQFFRAMQVGEEYQIHCLREDHVFDIRKISGVSLKNKKRFSSQSYGSTPVRERISEEQKKVVKAVFWKAILWRTVVGGIVAYISFYIIFVFALILFGTNGVDILTTIFYGTIGLVGAVFLLINRKTFRLYRDLISNEVVLVDEVVIDKIQSTHRKPSPNSIVTTRKNYDMDDLRFQYIQTENYWIPVTKTQFDKIESGATITLEVAPHSKIILNEFAR